MQHVLTEVPREASWRHRMKKTLLQPESARTLLGELTALPDSQLLRRGLAVPPPRLKNSTFGPRASGPFGPRSPLLCVPSSASPLGSGWRRL